MEEKRPRVGMGVFVIKDGKILMGKRRNSHGDGTWSLPGGHLEYNEKLEQCAIREVMEETGVNIKNIRFSTITNDVFTKEDKHYITIFMLADYDSGDAQVLEPNKCEKWEWIAWEEMPRPLFIPIENLIKINYHPLK